MPCAIDCQHHFHFAPTKVSYWLHQFTKGCRTKKTEIAMGASLNCAQGRPKEGVFGDWNSGLGDDFRWSCARSWDSLCHGNPWILEESGWFWAWGVMNETMQQVGWVLSGPTGWPGFCPWRVSGIVMSQWIWGSEWLSGTRGVLDLGGFWEHDSIAEREEHMRRDQGPPGWLGYIGN